MALTTENAKSTSGSNSRPYAPAPPDAARSEHAQANSLNPSTPIQADLAIPRVPSPARFWCGVGAATALSLPFGWILSYAAALPFFVGAFFFALLGLMIGATAFRVAKAGAPYNKFAVVTGTTVIVLTGCLTTLVKEGRDFPFDTARVVADRTLDLGDRSVQEFQSTVADEVSGYLASHYPPGGTLGYVRWVLAGGEIRKGELTVTQQTIRAPQKGWIWIVRVALSIGLFAFGVGSQTLLLAPKRPKRQPALG